MEYSFNTITPMSILTEREIVPIRIPYIKLIDLRENPKIYIEILETI